LSSVLLALTRTHWNNQPQVPGINFVADSHTDTLTVDLELLHNFLDIVDAVTVFVDGIRLPW